MTINLAITVSFFFFFNLFMAVLGLRFCARAPSSCSKRGPLLIDSSSWCAGLSPSRPLPLWSTGSRRAGSAIVAHGPSCSTACGILPDQGSNPRPLHRQADSQPLRHQGSPTVSFTPFALTLKRPYLQKNRVLSLGMYKNFLEVSHISTLAYTK